MMCFFFIVLYLILSKWLSVLYRLIQFFEIHLINLRYHAAPANENQVAIYDSPENQYEEYEDIEGASDYLEVVSSSCSENGEQYEEVL